MGKASKGHKKQTPKKWTVAKKPAQAVTAKVASVALPEIPEGKKVVLHMDGGRYSTISLLEGFKTPEWFAVTLHHDAAKQADITLGLDQLDALPEGCFDAIWLPAILQRVSYHEVVPLLESIRRLLKPKGFITLRVPDVLSVCEDIKKKGFERPLGKTKDSAALIDVMYGARRAIAKGDSSLHHHTGFVSQSLANRLIMAKYDEILVRREGLHLFARATRTEMMVKDQKPAIIAPDLNEMMKARDEIDQPPVRWDNPKL